MSCIHLMSSKSKLNHGKHKVSDLVASWEVALSDGMYKIEFEHGTTTGKRVITVNNKVIMHFVLNSKCN